MSGYLALSGVLVAAYASGFGIGWWLRGRDDR